MKWLKVIIVVVLFSWAIPTMAQQDCIVEGVKNYNKCSDITCCSGLICQKTGVEYAATEGATAYDVVMCVKPVLGQALESGSTTTSETKPVIFTPQVTIPGTITIGGKEISFKAKEGVQITGDTLNNYFAVFYKFFISALAVIAVVMVMWGGFKRIMAAGSAEKIKDANDAIFSAISGLVLALVSYSLLQLINPELVKVNH